MTSAFRIVAFIGKGLEKGGPESHPGEDGSANQIFNVAQSSYQGWMRLIGGTAALGRDSSETVSVVESESYPRDGGVISHVASETRCQSLGSGMISICLPT
jgi:hypothetical protein